MAKRKADAPREPPEVQERAKAIRADDHVRYWVVLDMSDLFALKALPLSDGLLQQVWGHIHRQPFEPDGEFALRMQEADEKQLVAEGR